VLRRINMLGAVRNPGLYYVDPTTTVADVLALAGGASPDGYQNRIEVLRDGKRLPVELSLESRLADSAVQPGGSLFGLQESNPVDTGVAYKGPSGNYGTSNDPMTGDKIGGVNVFGGGLALYGPGKKLVGGVGVSGDTSCADHNIAWRVRKLLGFDHLLGVGGVSGDGMRPDNIIFDIAPNPAGGTGVSAGGFGHPMCLNTGGSGTLPPVQQ